MAAKFKKWFKKIENFDFDGLKLPKAAKNRYVMHNFGKLI